MNDARARLARGSARCLLALSLLVLSSQIRADAGWLEAGDPVLRADLQLLNDAEIIRMPVSQWPIPRAGLRYALDHAGEHFATNAAVQGALARVRARIAADDRRSRDHAVALDASLTAGSPALLRHFGTIGREEGEIGARATLDSERFEVSVNLSAVTSPADDRPLRADGSHATLQWGNWLLSANTLERFWGPSHESSLILSNNARPMPTLVIERAAARPFESTWLNWLGPWRFSFGISRMESEREDIDAPLFMAWRVVTMPFKDIEIGFTRTAQFCGKQLRCDLDSFGNMLAGNDNLGIDARPEDEPGNQMAGFDLRWSSPVGNLPYAVYGQMIGEDESSYMPAKYLAQFGVEVWRPLPLGGLVQTFLEYSDTSCSATTRRPRLGCAYSQGKFSVEGYRYRGRVIGHTTDKDSRSVVLGGSLTTEKGDYWSASLLAAELNREGTFNPKDTVAAVPTDYRSLELGWRGQWHGESVRVSVGAESIDPRGGSRDVGPYGFLSWQHQFTP